jgi:hypothetical protein
LVGPIQEVVEGRLMAKVRCEVEEVNLQNEKGYLAPGVRVTCGRCGHETESFGTSEVSIRRCLALLREECPEGESNFYVSEDA